MTDRAAGAHRAAIVLAAGRSDRMGRPKALLPCRGKTFLRTILDCLADAGVSEAHVVLGHAAESVRGAEGLGPSVATVNERYESGMLSSVRCGVRALSSRVDAFLLWPVDHPLVAASTVEALFAKQRTTGAAIVVPVCRGKRGHPALFTMRMAPELLAAPDSKGARAVLLAHPAEVVELPVEDPGVTADIDTPEAFEAAFGFPIPPSGGEGR